MTDEQALIRAVLIRPWDDTPRLVYADWLDEHVGEVECGACGGAGGLYRGESSQGDDRCGRCSGAGRLPTGNAARAEFVRVQCELGRNEANPCKACKWAKRGPCAACGDLIALRRRERDILFERWPDFLRAAFESFMPRVQFWAEDVNNFRIAAFDRGEFFCRFRRGFVAEVECTTAVFLGGPCGRCDGDGLRHGSDRTYPPTPCPACHGTGLAPGIAPASFADSPVGQVKLTGKTAVKLEGAEVYRWWRHRRQEAAYSWELPPALFDLLPHRYARFVRDDHHEYESKADCEAALSAACVTFGRKAAGLPPSER